jgi:autotransporter adhesin
VGGAGAERQITNVAAGTADTDAVNVSQLKAVQNDVNDLRSESRHGIAAAMAMAAVPMPSAPGKLAWGMNGANFKDAYAGAFSAAYRFNTATPFVVSASAGYAGNKAAGVRVGFSGEF